MKKLTTTAGRGRPEVEQPKVGPKGETRGSERVKDTEQATPETDAKVSGHIGFYSCATVPAELCRRMERERDEARHDFEVCRNKWDIAVTMAARAENERDEAREELEHWKIEYDIVEARLRGIKHERDNGIISENEVIPKLKRERNQARDQVEELTAVIKGLRAIMRQDATK